MARIAGYDVGGAHLKAALASDGKIVAVRQIACPLWKGLDRLAAALDAADEICSGADLCAVTMTGELADLFPTRAAGVRAIADSLEARFGARLAIWSGLGREGRPLFLAPAQARQWPDEVGSTNHLAPAWLTGRHFRAALVVDVGSTTSDLVPVVGGEPWERWASDALRLESGGLVYQGLTRTPVMAVAARVPVAGRWRPLMNELFATMADVRRVAGDLPDDVDQYETADGRGKSSAESLARLGRMLAADPDPGDADLWRPLALYLVERQLWHIVEAAFLRLSNLSLAPDAPVVGAGIGADFLARPLAERLKRPFVAFADLLPVAEDARLWAGRCAPAAALALLGGHLQPID